MPLQLLMTLFKSDCRGCKRAVTPSCAVDPSKKWIKQTALAGRWIVNLSGTQNMTYRVHNNVVCSAVAAMFLICIPEVPVRISTTHSMPLLNLHYRIPHCGMSRHVALVRIDVSEDRIAPIIMLIRIGELRATLAVITLFQTHQFLSLW
jgi:hypothetical protein